MKTLFLFQDRVQGAKLFAEQGMPDTFFFELEGDYSHLNDVLIGEFASDLDADELTDLIYDFRGDLKVKRLEAPTRDWDHFVRVGAI